MIASIIEKYKGSLAILKKKPILLWGLTLLTQFLAFMASVLGMLPIIVLPVTWALSVGLAGLYLKGYRGDDVKTDDVFTGFKQFIKVACGMAWMVLWVVIWALIPIVGPIFAVIKLYEYAFVPYILLEKPEYSATEALKKSKEMTCGYKAQMFWSQAFVVIAFIAVLIVMIFFVRIPYIGGLFGFILFLFIAAVALFAPIFLGLIQAGFYDTSDKASTPMTLPLHEDNVVEKAAE